MPNSWDLPPSFRFAVQDTPDPNVVKVDKGQWRDGRTVDVAPFTRENLDKVATLIAQLRFGKQPAVDYLTNQFVDLHRASGRSHVVGQSLTASETQDQTCQLGPAAADAEVNRMGNCDGVNATGYREQLPVFGSQHPVLYHWPTENNHHTVLVGDPRMPQYGERNTVVADSHAVFPMPHTLDQAAYGVHLPREGEDGDEDLEHSWLARDNERDTALLPEAISVRQQRHCLCGWPAQAVPGAICPPRLGHGVAQKNAVVNHLAF